MSTVPFIRQTLPSFRTPGRRKTPVGDFSLLASRMVLAGEQLCESAGLQTGDIVLDVATGRGNAALAAARRGCTVIGADSRSPLLDHAIVRAFAEKLDVDFIEANSENLPFEDASFDATLSAFGATFAADHRKTAAELARVTRPGGKIALAFWTPEGFVGQLFDAISPYVPTIVGFTPPMSWGDPAYLAGLFGETASHIAGQLRTAVFRFRSADDTIAFLQKYYGPTLETFESLPHATQLSLARDLTTLARLHDPRQNTTGPITIHADYLETIITRA